ncbi:acetylornithine deacetylase [Neolewinella antarctica]|uniref:Acetylornithine deacetylase n=1 Tax=Neolewinella antarctica TaxID=442734 RepID=A0ABX0XFC0_9BACT|nr:acetylornithine deacetylase [Neolewinella antarctica]NJC28014.1 acetylornithine deacetylase [Neolewinella antarctica]
MNDPQEILRKLVAFNVLGGEPNLEIIDWIEKFLSDLGVESHRVYNEEKTKAALHCRIGPAADGGIILSGHTDVVPTVGQPWETDPFVLTQKGDKLYGRGSCDMKGFIACCLASVPHFQQANLAKPVYFAFSFDEEIGCRSGDLTAAAIRDFYPEKPAGAIIGEPTMLRPIVGQKGIMVYTTTVHGSQGHSSRIKDEVDAVQEAARLIVWLEDKMDALIAAGRLDDRFHPNHTSIHTGKISGGSAFNIIANECSFDWEFRNIPLDDADGIINDFQAYCAERIDLKRKTFSGFDVTHVALHPPVPPLDTPEDAPIVELIKELTGISETDTVSYAAEAGQFSRQGFPSVICGPGDIAQAHRANEFVGVGQLGGCMALLGRLAQRLGV